MLPRSEYTKIKETFEIYEWLKKESSKKEISNKMTGMDFIQKIYFDENYEWCKLSEVILGKMLIRRVGNAKLYEIASDIKRYSNIGPKTLKEFHKMLRHLGLGELASW